MDVPFSLCSFLHKKNVLGASYAYTTEVSSSRSVHVHFTNRTKEIRTAGVKVDFKKRTRMKEGDLTLLEDSPLNMLQKGLQAAKTHTPTTEKFRRAFSAIFETYNNTAVSTDHALMGVSKNLFELFFEALSDEETRTTLDVHVCSELTSNGLPVQASIFSNSCQDHAGGRA